MTPRAAKKSLDSNKRISALEDIILIVPAVGAKIEMIYWIDGAFASSAARPRPRPRPRATARAAAAPTRPTMYALPHDAR
jgi:hypothetical protein